MIEKVESNVLPVREGKGIAMWVCWLPFFFILETKLEFSQYYKTIFFSMSFRPNIDNKRITNTNIKNLILRK